MQPLHADSFDQASDLWSQEDFNRLFAKASILAVVGLLFWNHWRSQRCADHCEDDAHFLGFSPESRSRTKAAATKKKARASAPGQPSRSRSRNRSAAKPIDVANWPGRRETPSPLTSPLSSPRFAKVTRESLSDAPPETAIDSGVARRRRRSRSCKRKVVEEEPAAAVGASSSSSLGLSSSLPTAAPPRSAEPTLMTRPLSPSPPATRSGVRSQLQLGSVEQAPASSSRTGRRAPPPPPLLSEVSAPPASDRGRAGVAHASSVSSTSTLRHAHSASAAPERPLLRQPEHSSHHLQTSAKLPEVRKAPRSPRSGDTVGKFPGTGQAVSCAFAECEWIGISAEYEAHTATCPYRLRPSPKPETIQPKFDVAMLHKPTQRAASGAGGVRSVGRANFDGQLREAPWTEVGPAGRSASRPRERSQPQPVRAAPDIPSMPHERPETLTASRGVLPQSSLVASQRSHSAAPSRVTPEEPRLRQDRGTAPTYNPMVGAMRAYSSTRDRSQSQSRQASQPPPQRDFSLSHMEMQFPCLPEGKSHRAPSHEFVRPAHSGAGSGVLPRATPPRAVASVSDPEPECAPDEERTGPRHVGLDTSALGRTRSPVVRGAVRDSDRGPGRLEQFARVYDNSKPQTNGSNHVEGNAAKESNAANGLVASTPSAGPERLSRSMLVDRIFKALDHDADGKLLIEEMLEFARMTGFDASLAVWQTEYRMLCKEYKVSPQDGMTFDAFLSMVNDTSEGGCHCPDQELRGIYHKLGRPTAARAPVRSPSPGVARSILKAPPVHKTGPPRDSCVAEPASRRGVEDTHAPEHTEESGFWEETNARKVVQTQPAEDAKPAVLDDMKVRAQETYAPRSCEEEVVKQSTGAEAAAPKRDISVSTHVAGNGVSRPSTGMPPALVPGAESLKEDLSSNSDPKGSGNRDGGTANRNRFGKQLSRAAVVELVFDNIDRDGDGLLCDAEMRCFAELTGFDGGDAAWHDEYRIICQDHACDPARGVARSIFKAMVDDKSELGCYCDDQELLGIHKKLSTPRPATSRGATATSGPAGRTPRGPATKEGDLERQNGALRVLAPSNRGPVGASRPSLLKGVTPAPKARQARADFDAAEAKENGAPRKTAPHAKAAPLADQHADEAKENGAPRKKAPHAKAAPLADQQADEAKENGAPHKTAPHAKAAPLADEQAHEAKENGAPEKTAPYADSFPLAHQQADEDDILELAEDAEEEFFLNTCGLCGETWLLPVDIGLEFTCQAAGKPCGPSATEAAVASFLMTKIADGEAHNEAMQLQAKERKAQAMAEAASAANSGDGKRPLRYLGGSLVQVQKGTKYLVTAKETADEMRKTSCSIAIIGSRSKPAREPSKKAGPKS